MYSKLSLLVVVSTVLLSSIYVAYSSNSVSELVSTMLNDEHLLGCEVIFIKVEGENSLNNIFKSNASAAASQSTQAPVPTPNYNPFYTSSGTFTVNLKRNETSSLKYRRLQDIHRLNKKHCGVAFMFISQVAPDLPQWLFETIIPRYVPIIRKDEDHFLFVFNNGKDASKILLSPEFGSKIKFKAAIVKPTEPSLRPKIQYVDLYAKRGECDVKTVQLPSAGLKSLFVDRSNFNGKRLRVVTPKAPSYFEMKPDGSGKQTYHPVRGLYKTWLDVMMERFNFTIELYLSSASGSTGKRLKNGTWVGSVGDILSGRADMASFNGHIYNRHEYVDWSAPLTYEWMVFVTHKPKSFFSPSAIYRPFPKMLWVGLAVSVTFICIVFKLISMMACPTYLPMSFRGLIMHIFSSFLEQGSFFYLQIFHLDSARVLSAFWLVFTVIMSTAYRGKLVSLIAFPECSWVPTTFEELAYSDYRVGLNVFGKGGATYAVLSTSKSPIYQTFFSKMQLYPDPVKCLSEAFHHDMGCLMVKSVADFYGARNFTDKFGRNPFQASEQTALFREDGYIWEKRAIFRHHFDKKTWSIMETGLSSLWFQNDLYHVKKKRLDWERENPGANSKNAIANQDGGHSKLQVEHLIGLFYVYVLGHVVGFFCVISEKVNFHRCKRKLTRSLHVRKIEIKGIYPMI